MKSTFSFLLLSASMLASACVHDRYGLDASYTIGQITAPCAGAAAQKCVINDDLREIDRCTNIDTSCEGGNNLLNDLFGNTRHMKFANYIVYFDQHEHTGTFASHRPILMWNGQNSRYLYGVQEVYFLLFTEDKSCFGAEITTLAKNEPNPFDVVLKALGKSLGPNNSPAVLTTHAAQFVWYPLSGDTARPVMWLAIGSVPVDINTTDWITVHFMQPATPKSSTEPTATANASSGPLKAENSGSFSDPCIGDRALTYSAPFLARNGFFSNNRESAVAVAVAFGLTLNGKETGPQGPTNPNLNGYALAKFYPSWRFMPKLVTDPNSTGGSVAYVRPSVGIVIGTNIGSPAFSEMVVGVSVGHLLGNVGLIAGVNDFVPAKASAASSAAASSAAATGTTGDGSRRRMRPFVGLEYSF